MFSGVMQVRARSGYHRLSVVTSHFDPLRRASFFLILPRNSRGMGFVESRLFFGHIVFLHSSM
jgi:hypothetical protein